MVFEIHAFLCFAFLKKKLKIQNGRHLYSLKLGKASLHRYPASQKFYRNHSISHGFRIQAYLLKLGKASLHRYLVGQKFCRNPTSKFSSFKKYSYIT